MRYRQDRRRSVRTDRAVRMRDPENRRRLSRKNPLRKSARYRQALRLLCLSAEGGSGPMIWQ